ncbi:MAG: flagellar hook-length control protein FliK [Nitratireductor sp.]
MMPFPLNTLHKPISANVEVGQKLGQKEEQRNASENSFDAVLKADERAKQDGALVVANKDVLADTEQQELTSDQLDVIDNADLDTGKVVSADSAAPAPIKNAASPDTRNMPNTDALEVIESAGMAESAELAGAAINSAQPAFVGGGVHGNPSLQTNATIAGVQNKNAANVALNQTASVLGAIASNNTGVSNTEKANVRVGSDVVKEGLQNTVAPIGNNNKATRIDNMPLSLNNKVSANLNTTANTNSLISNQSVKVATNIEAPQVAGRLMDTNSEAFASTAASKAGIKVEVKVENTPVQFGLESRVENLGKALQELARGGSSQSTDQLQSQSATSATSRAMLTPQTNNVVGLKTIEVQLLPKSLGVIQVTIEQLDGKLSLQIEAQTAKGEAALKQESMKIVESIRAAGMLVEEVNVKRNPDLNLQSNGRSDVGSEPEQKFDFSKNENTQGSMSEQKEQNATQNINEIETKNTESILAEGNLRSGIYL